ncbi:MULTISPECIES: ADP-ribosylglycohydrolase family protein [unclassified Halanaerobium]|uniref:ADP-ribosylglycohydrolase family protein n=1 Tax=unclassified Halanaerobium TaxID=2641197 RepID=UPI000DF11451|nr:MULTISPECIES: ADP-ribosylglycohydrolase family protein [unclassified Halanaerobium]RCW48733.1 ADP-ribosylglycohydrolase [Halanaerobium sp. MA284_MarDTE_T2]RCW89075.1 ADP-ribosylglycohydrolase [Halanaerobium sp. DL-01]
MDIYERIYSSLMGTAVGDALGMPFEMMSGKEIKLIHKQINDFYDIPEKNFLKRDLSRAQVTDDTFLTFHLADYLLKNNGKMDKDDYILDFARYIKTNKLIERSLIGPSTSNIVKKLLKGEKLLLSDRTGTTSGLVMKISPVGLIFPPAKKSLMLQIIEQTAYYSHYTDTAITAACGAAAAVSEAAAGSCLDKIISESIDMMEKGEKLGIKTYQPSVSARTKHILKFSRSAFSREEVLIFISEVIGTGISAADVFPAALVIFKLYADDGYQALKKAASIGGDTDTIASITGSILGAYKGYLSFPKKWEKDILQINNLEIQKTAEKITVLRSDFSG